MIDRFSPITNEIVASLESDLDKLGVYYRIFARGKSANSIAKKLLSKAEKYKREGTKMQDIIGIRIVFYFAEDVDYFYSFLKCKSNFISESNSFGDLEVLQKNIDKVDLSTAVFMPTRLNLIFRMNSSESQILKGLLPSVCTEKESIDLIDDTYEIQLRTVLSEGWHEVEHDLRYKTLGESWWKSCEKESRMLNGIYATLETSENAMAQVFASIAYKNYKNNCNEAMIRNHFCLRISELPLNSELNDILDARNVNEVAKEIFRTPRCKLIEKLSIMRFPYPITVDNIVFLANRMIPHSEKSIVQKEPTIISKILNDIFD